MHANTGAPASTVASFVHEYKLSTLTGDNLQFRIRPVRQVPATTALAFFLQSWADRERGVERFRVLVGKEQFLIA